MDIHRVHIDIRLLNVLRYRMSRKRRPSLAAPKSGEGRPPNLPPARPDDRSCAHHKSSTSTCKNSPLSDLLIVQDLKSTRINTSKISKISRILFPTINFNPTRINTSGNKDLKPPRINTSGHKDLKSNHFNTSKKHGRGAVEKRQPNFSLNAPVPHRCTQTARPGNHSRRLHARAPRPMLE
jgi:hypothetical protein